MKPAEPVTAAFDNWLKQQANSAGLIPKGTIAGGLAVLERLRKKCKLDIDAHTAKGGSQVAGTGGSTVKKILERFGEKRPFVSEGGRTNRGLRGAMATMLDSLREGGLLNLTEPQRKNVLTGLQRKLVEKVAEFHSRQRLKVPYAMTDTTREFVRRLLATAREQKKDAPLAQYLVGAKLQLRFPKKDIANHASSVADQQLKRPGDFAIENTAFHVTVAPSMGLYGRCRQNIDSGLDVYIIVPESAYLGVKQIADQTAPGRITVVELEAFVSQNIDELSEFSTTEKRSRLRELLGVYNKRVDAIEIDKSLLIDMPPNL